ncbi:choice-of-anchor L domain-containing protein [Flavobacterium sp.]|uniref:choice-of-anchor L domain-containing protein n=1 Tax=Flavobacterium sp. TaxID=239 RepID=UPI003D2BD717
MLKKYYIYLLVLFTYIQSANAQAISVNESYTPQQLIEDVLLQSSCASVSNVTVSGGNFATGELSYGFFDANGSSFPFQNGIILSTGKINNAPGPNTSILEDGGNMGWDGDTDLQDALGLSNSFNATILEFDFIPLGDQISFDYMLSSEQYLTNPSSNQCNFTDGFAFLLKEVGTTSYQNLAVIPGTSTPVKINTVRGSGTICPPANEQYFDAFNGDNHPTNFNGQTKILTAQANVTPGTQYHIKLVIADEGNYRYDSAIFLGGGSFNFGVNIGQDRLLSNGNPICNDEATTTNPFILDATYTGATYQWKYNNTNISGATNATLEIPSSLVPTLQNGIYSVDVTIGTCTIPSNITLEFAPSLNVIKDTFILCDDDNTSDGKTAFDLNAMKNEIFSNLPSNYQVDFFETSTSTTPLPLSYTNTTAYSQPIYARITNIQGCYNDFQINLIVNVFDEIITDETIGLCDGNSIILDAGAGFISYNWNTNPAQSSQMITVNTPGTYVVTLENSTGCFKNKTFSIVGSQIATITNVEINDFNSSNSATIITSGNGTYEFSLDGINYQDSNFFSNLEAGEYLVYVQDKNGCGIVTNTFYILDYPKFFTPNNDGYNDTWQIKNLEKRGFEASKIYIFDRYGKLLKQISPLEQGWDGYLNGTALPSTDYWFVLELTNGRTIRSHFALKR